MVLPGRTNVRSVDSRQEGIGEEAWAVKGDFVPKRLKSNLFEVEWPPRNGKTQLFPEVDCAEWFALPEARVAGQLPFLNRLEPALKSA